MGCAARRSGGAGRGGGAHRRHHHAFAFDDDLAANGAHGVEDDAVLGDIDIFDGDGGADGGADDGAGDLSVGERSATDPADGSMSDDVARGL